MVDPSWLIGVPPLWILYVLVKCGYEVGNVDDISDVEANRLYLKCIFDDMIPSGLPDPDRFDDYE